MSDPADDINYFKAAFLWQYNLILLGGAAAFAVVSGSELPLLLAGGIELMYLATVPQMERFRRLARSWRYADEKKAMEAQQRQLIGTLPADFRSRFDSLKRLSESIELNYRRLSSTSQTFWGQLQQQLNGLLSSYIRLAHAQSVHKEYLQTTNPALIQREITDLESRLAKDGEKVREINQKRIEILKKRVEKFARIRENQQVIYAQCQAIEDVLHLIRDQSMTMSDPQQVSERLETLMRDVEQTEETIREVESIFQMAPMVDGIGDESSGGERNRVRN